MGLFFNNGQCCIASSRVFVHEKVYDEFVGMIGNPCLGDCSTIQSLLQPNQQLLLLPRSSLTQLVCMHYRIASIKTSYPLDPSCNQGPIVDEAQFKKILGFIESGKAEGARCVVGGVRHGDKVSVAPIALIVDQRAD